MVNISLNTKVAKVVVATQFMAMCFLSHVCIFIFYHHSGCRYLEIPSSDSPALSSITTLFLNDMNLTWNKVWNRHTHCVDNE